MEQRPKILPYKDWLKLPLHPLKRQDRGMNLFYWYREEKLQTQGFHTIKQVKTCNSGLKSKRIELIEWQMAVRMLKYVPSKQEPCTSNLLLILLNPSESVFTLELQDFEALQICDMIYKCGNFNQKLTLCNINSNTIWLHPLKLINFEADKT